MSRRPLWRRGGKPGAGTCASHVGGVINGPREISSTAVVRRAGRGFGRRGGPDGRGRIAGPAVSPAPSSGWTNTASVGGVGSWSDTARGGCGALRRGRRHEAGACRPAGGVACPRLHPGAGRDCVGRGARAECVPNSGRQYGARSRPVLGRPILAARVVEPPPVPGEPPGVRPERCPEVVGGDARAPLDVGQPGPWRSRCGKRGSPSRKESSRRYCETKFLVVCFRSSLLTPLPGAETWNEQ